MSTDSKRKSTPDYPPPAGIIWCATFARILLLAEPISAPLFASSVIICCTSIIWDRVLLQMWRYQMPSHVGSTKSTIRISSISSLLLKWKALPASFDSCLLVKFCHEHHLSQNAWTWHDWSLQYLYSLICRRQSSFSIYHYLGSQSRCTSGYAIR